MNTADLIARIKKNPTSFSCALICLLSAGWLYFRSDVIATRQAEYEAKSAEAARIISNVSISKNLPEQVAEIQASTKILESRLVRASQQALNLQYFYKLEAENEVKLLDVRQNSLPPSKGAKSSLYTGIPYTVNVQGPFKQLMAFLQRLENGRHFCRINTATFNRPPGISDSASTGMTMALSLELLGQP